MMIAGFAGQYHKDLLKQTVTPLGEYIDIKSLLVIGENDNIIPKGMMIIYI